jgi:geranylgeranyl reductase family protein
MDTCYDAIVVGAGPGGASCSIVLSKNGFRVLLLDKDHFPRDKICGDALSDRSLEVMKALDFDKKFRELEHTTIHKVMLKFPSVTPCYLGSQKRHVAGAVCRRKTLDSALYAHAQGYCETLEGFKVKSLLYDSGQVVGVSGRDSEGEKTFFSKVVIGADGANSIIARSLGVTLMEPAHNAVAIRAYYEGVQLEENTIEIHFLKELSPGYFWVFPTGGAHHEANVGLGLVSSHVRNKKYNMKERLHSILKEHPQLSPRFENAQMKSALSGWSLPMGSKQRELSFPGCVLVGDAAGLINPFTGEGVGYAMFSGHLAAQVLNPLLKKGNPPSKKELDVYQTLLRKEVNNEHRVCYGLQKVLRVPFLTRLFALGLKHSEFLRERAIHLFNS